MPFEIVADENIDPQISNALRSAGHHIVSIWQEHRGMADTDILKMALAQGMLIVTEDKDFGEYVFSHKMTSGGVIFLRYEFSEMPQIISILRNLLERTPSELNGKFVVITPRKIRIRDL